MSRLAQTIEELREAIAHEVKQCRGYCLTPNGWHVIWGLDGELRGTEAHVHKVCSEHTLATGQPTVMFRIGLLPGEVKLYAGKEASE